MSQQAVTAGGWLLTDQKTNERLQGTDLETGKDCQKTMRKVFQTSEQNTT